MAYTKNIWSDKVVSTPNKYTKSLETSTSVTLVQDPGTVTNAGTPVTAPKMNNIENGLESVTKTADDLQILFWMGAN